MRGVGQSKGQGASLGQHAVLAPIQMRSQPCPHARVCSIVRHSTYAPTFVASLSAPSATSALMTSALSFKAATRSGVLSDWTSRMTTWTGPEGNKQPVQQMMQHNAHRPQGTRA